MACLCSGNTLVLVCPLFVLWTLLLPVSIAPFKLVLYQVTVEQHDPYSVLHPHKTLWFLTGRVLVQCCT